MTVIFEQNIAEAFEVLKTSALALFQARKLGIVVHIPDEVRQAMIATYNEEARKILNFLDGNVHVYFHDEACRAPGRLAS